MADLNQFTGMGRLTRDPDLKFLQNQTAVCNFGLAMGRVWYDANKQKCEDVTFLDCVAWGTTAEVINKYVAKGKRILCVGWLKLEQWDDKDTGHKRSKIVLNVERVSLIDFVDDGKGGGGGNNSQGSQQGGQQGKYQKGNNNNQRQGNQQRGGGQQRQNNQQQEPPVSDEPQFTNDDIPF